MATTVNIKRKNIDLPVDTLKKLSLLAVSQGKSLKKYIESILISKAESVSVEVIENPSPSGDIWYDDPSNIEAIDRGIADMEAGRVKSLSMDEIRNKLGL